MSEWDATFYDRKIGFVSAFGADVIEWLRPVAGERILDLGCGTGDLTAAIAKRGAEVKGIDQSPAMIREARRKYPHLTFEVQDARRSSVNGAYEAVFSNAVLHWIPEAKAVAESVSRALRAGGRFVGEMGGQDNVSTLTAALKDALCAEGISAMGRNPWYFPSLAQYCGVLEACGFVVRQAIWFERPTPLADGPEGVRGWIHAFGGHFTEGLDEEVKERVITRVEEQVRRTLWDGERYVADYRRLRFWAEKRD